MLLADPTRRLHVWLLGSLVSPISFTNCFPALCGSPRLTYGFRQGIGPVLEEALSVGDLAPQRVLIRRIRRPAKTSNLRMKRAYVHISAPRAQSWIGVNDRA